ncbi:unnamed protein product, partial [Ectocarpus sp. 13 AM-2016]
QACSKGPLFTLFSRSLPAILFTLRPWCAPAGRGIRTSTYTRDSCLCRSSPRTGDPCSASTLSSSRFSSCS